MSNLKRTPLYEQHLAAQAKMVDFGGWEMPVQYAGVIEEHHTVRTKAGLFDVSHMGEIDVQGPDAFDFVQQLITNDASKLADLQIIYSPMCYPSGGVVDDLLVYRQNAQHFLIVVNAANVDKDFAWMQEQVKSFRLALNNVSDRTAELAIQGPLAEQILQRITGISLAEIKYYWFINGRVDGVACLISRTGYTGEDGFEIYCAPEHAAQLWSKLLATGNAEGIEPIGLGARDTLRFEARLPLYGHELSQDISPLEAGLGAFVKLDKPGFIGQQALKTQMEQGLPRKLVGLEMVERGIARSGYPVTRDGAEIGFITSGSFAPSLNKNIGLALIRGEYAAMDSEFDVIIRGKPVKAKIVPTPFYKRSRRGAAGLGQQVAR